MTPNKTVIASGAIVIAILFLGGVAVSNFRNTYSISGIHSADNFAPKPVGDARNHPSDESSIDSLSHRTLESPPPLRVQFGLYDKYLDQICPRLTVAEEDSLISAFGKDVQTLVGLVFAGSKRPEVLLKEALRRDPHNPLVHYAILAGQYHEFDLLKSALELAKLAPLDAAPLYAAALETFKTGDRASAMSYLAEAAQRTEFSSFHAAALEAAINAFQLAGRSQDDALTRVSLQNNGQWEVATLGRLREALGIIGPDRQTLWGSDDATALLLGASQMAFDAPGFDLATYMAAITDATDYLRAIERAQTPKINSYMSVPASEWLASAEAQDTKLNPILLFAQDKPGVYERLDKSQKVELINRISQDGEVAAFLWAYQTRPDIFRSADFRPQTAHPRFWTRYVNQ